MPKKQVQCSQCRTYADPDLSEFTLIGAEHGWRVLKRPIGPARDAKFTLEWLCPECWKKRKENQP